MPLVSFKQLMDNADKYEYAVGYFECWSLDSLLAVCDAAENKRSPVIIGFSGIDFPNYRHLVKDFFDSFANIVNDLAAKCSVPVCSIFNESPSKDLILKGIARKLSIAMFLDPTLSFSEQKSIIKYLTREAHKNNVAVEGEIEAQAGLGENTIDVPEEDLLTDVETAKLFIKETGIDALAVNIGQVSFTNEKKSKLNFEHLKKLREEIRIPLVLHGGSSISDEEIKKAIELGIRKINIGKTIKQAYLKKLRNSFIEIKEEYNPYKVIGSGLDQDVLIKAKMSMQKAVEVLMVLFGSAGKAF